MSLISHNHGMWLGFLQGLQFDVKIGGKIRHVLYGGVTLSNWLHPLMLTCTTLFRPSSPLITSQHCLRGAWKFNYFSNVLDTKGFTDPSKISNSRCLLCMQQYKNIQPIFSYFQHQLRINWRVAYKKILTCCFFMVWTFVRPTFLRGVHVAKLIRFC